MLIDRHGHGRPDPWAIAEDGAIAGLPDAIVPWAALADAQATRSPGQRLGILVPNTVRTEELAPSFGALDLIAVAFPAFSDGRGFSLARNLRRRDFAGTLRAAGPLIADQFPYALACGFDEIALPEASATRQSAGQWLAALRVVSHGYQRGYGVRANILDQRRAARASAGAAR
jgi:uncharacterized protein (DUF934 family)